MSEPPRGPTGRPDPPAAPRHRYVRVAVHSGQRTRLTFTYHLPPGREPVPGEVVHVPFGARTLQGVVLEGPLDLAGYAGTTRPVDPPVEGAPVIAGPRLELALWIADRYLAPAWECCALMLPPGSGERSQSLVVRAAAAGPEASLPEGQARLYALLGERPRPEEELRQLLGRRGFEPALRALLRRGLAERRYRLLPPRVRARVAEAVRLLVPPGRARESALAIEGRRPSRPARVLRALVEAGGALPREQLVRAARGPGVVEALVAGGWLEPAPGEGEAGAALRLAVPARRAEQEARRLHRTRAEQAEAALLERLADRAERGLEPAARLADLGRGLGPGARAAARALADRALVAVEEVLERRDPLAGLSVVSRPRPELIGDQRVAAARARDRIDRAAAGAEGCQELLIVGVTGSGKTEVYLDALAHAVERGRRGIVLVPEIALTPQTVRRFSERFPGRVGVLHSGLSPGEAFDEWHAASEGRYDVVVGSRSALFAPLPDLGLVVIDEAHEWTYKQGDPPPGYDARDVARRLCELEGAALVLGTATPSAEQWYRAAAGELERVDLPRRVRPVPQPGGGVAVWPSDELPAIEVVDMRGARTLFSDPLALALEETLDRGEQAILFLNRRGLAGFLLCPQGHSPECSSCDVALALHTRGEPGAEPGAAASPGLLLCHQCGRRRRVPTACDRCGGALRPARAGTERVEREVRRLYPAARVARWDRDTARRRSQHEAILGRFLGRELDVLVGTQMVAKGLDLPAVTLVGVVLADYTLREGDFRSRERTFQLLVQVGGRAGRAERGGRVVIQTLQPGDRAVQAAAAGDVDGFLEQELQWRVEHGYPPIRRLARLLFAHPRPAYAAEEAGRVAAEVRRLASGRPDAEVLGPLRPLVARVRGRHRWSIVVKADDPAELLRRLDLPAGWRLEIDPASID